ncbi:MAG: polysaccharide pyruvyl transferase family protein [Saccharofermentans sp.]|nr:polysaccharide pyruvyl transferase family protein [Saccharofermentans sp.]
MKKIAVVGWDKSLNNIGDILLIDVSCWICERNNRVQTVRMDWSPDYILSSIQYNFFWKLRMFMGAPFHTFSFTSPICGQLKYWSRKLWFNIYLKDYYRKSLCEIDAVLVAGGGVLKYETQDHSFYTECLLEVAKELNLPVMLNAIGIEQYNEKDQRCIHLINTINHSTIKCITTRDDIYKLQNHFVTSDSIKTDLVADPVWWLKEVYEKPSSIPKDTIGINLLQGTQFLQYGEHYLEESELLDLYMNIAMELSRRGHKWCFFCNGMQSDYEFGVKILQKMGLNSDDYLLQIHQNSEEYVSRLSEFKAIIAGRMHAAISAYALNIPVAAMVWSKKLVYFAEMARISEYFLQHEKITAENIVDAVERAISNSEKTINQKASLQNLKNRTLEYVDDYISDI